VQYATVKMGMVDPDRVTQVPSVPLNTPLPTPTVTPAPTTSTATAAQ
jgi:hypothetical protein